MKRGTVVPSGREQVAWQLFRGALFTLPWVGMGVARLVTGRDLGAGLQPSWLLLCLVVLLLPAELLKFLRQNWRIWVSAVGPLVVALAVSVLGLWLAPSGEPLTAGLWRFVKQIIQVDVMAAFVVVPAYYLGQGYTLASLARPVVWGALFQLGYGAVQGIHFFYPLDLTSGLEQVFTSNPAILAGSGQLYLGNVLQQVPRLRGTVCEPLYLGNFLLLALPLVAVCEWRRLRQGVVSGLLLLLLILTWSRGAWLGGVGGALFGAVLAARTAGWKGHGLPSGGRLARALGGVVVALVGLGLWLPELALPWQRLLQTFSTADWSNLTRLYSMQAAWRAFLLSPVVGIGWGQFGFHFASLVDPMGLQSMFSWPVVNNLPLAILCETGIVGGAGFLWLVAFVWRSCRKVLQSGDGQNRPAVVLLMTVNVAIWLQLLTFSQYNLPHIWLAMGLLTGVLAAPSPASREARA